MVGLTKYRTSIHGNRLALDDDDNVKGLGFVAEDSAGNDQRIDNTVETKATGTTLSLGGFSNIGSSLATTNFLSTITAIGQKKSFLNTGTATLIMRIEGGATTIAFSGSATLQAMQSIVAGAVAEVQRISASRYLITNLEPSTGWTATS